MYMVVQHDIGQLLFSRGPRRTSWICVERIYFKIQVNDAIFDLDGFLIRSTTKACICWRFKYLYFRESTFQLYFYGFCPQRTTLDFHLKPTTPQCCSPKHRYPVKSLTISSGVVAIGNRAIIIRVSLPHQI